jgi:lipoate-protein ligase A
MLRYIYDTARSAEMNMAIDEVLFDEIQAEPVLRVYFWDRAYSTIGYFQKNDGTAVRRLTGGLLVNHQYDLSYGFCATAQEWAHIYSQQDTYSCIHGAIKKALAGINIESSFAQIKRQNAGKNMLCVQTLYSGDLIYGGKKILGSCMRRRGKKILVQGSLHLDLGSAEKEEFSKNFAQNMAALLKTGIKREEFTKSETEKAYLLAREKYSSGQWNGKN